VKATDNGKHASTCGYKATSKFNLFHLCRLTTFTFAVQNRIFVINFTANFDNENTKTNIYFQNLF